MRASHTTALGIISLLLATAAVARGSFKEVFKETRTEQSSSTTESREVSKRTNDAVAGNATNSPKGTDVVAGRMATVPKTTTTPLIKPQVKTQAAVARGEALLLRGKVADAAKVFETQAESVAPAEQASTFFRLGVQWQKEAAQLPQAQQAEARRAAASAYERTLQVNPKSGAALNNLAQIYRSDPGQAARADELLTQAIALNDSHKGVYLLNRAALKRDAGDLKVATELAEQAAAADKGNLEAHQMVMNVALVREDARPLLDYIDDLNTRGLVVRALDSAAAGLTKFPNNRRQLLTSVARTISNSAYTADPWVMAETAAGQAIGKFREDPAIGAGVNELFQVLRAPVPAGTLRWWTEGFNASMWPQEGSPAEAMQNLTRRCGEIYHGMGDGRAEGYYRMSVDLNGRMNADARALLGLSEILYEQKRIDDLNKLLAANEPGLMDAKLQTVAKADHLHTYELRLALGMMYGYVGRWKNSIPPTYAASIWMLEHAQQSAEDYNQQARLPPEERVKLPPNAVRMLSTGYAKTGDLRRSVEVRLRAAELYLTGGQKRFAQLVLDPEWQRTLPGDLDAGLKQRLAQITARANT